MMHLRRSPIALVAIAIAIVCALLLARTPAGARGPQTSGVREQLNAVSSAQRHQRPSQQQLPQRSHAARVSRRDVQAAAALDTIVLATFDFDGTGGGPDHQGWSSFDGSDKARTVKGTFFHVDDFTGLVGYAPLQGARSLWCGVRPNDSTGVCRWATAPGYGNFWSQLFESRPFAALGDVTFSYKIKWDSEVALLDVTQVQYRDTAGVWISLPVDGGSGEYCGSGESTDSFTIPSAAFGDSIRLRFGFFSDGAWSDEDGLWPTNGAVLIDSVTVSDTTGVIDFQDFESEPVGALVTNDGDWQARVFNVFGDFAGLFDGASVLQEDSVTTNLTWLWGFFKNSPDNFGCGGHPEQPVVPFGRPSEGCCGVYISNEIWSPVIDYTRDINGFAISGSTTAAFLEFDVYQDLPPNNAVVYSYSVRSFVNGCPTTWSLNTFLWAVGPQWAREIFQIDGQVDSAATEIQIKLICRDVCTFLCVSPFGDCHSHLPLFDNVRITKAVDIPTGIHDPPVIANALEQNVPNPFNPATTVRFFVREKGRVTLRIYNVAGQLVSTLVDENLAPRAEGFSAAWDGTDQAGRIVASGVYFYRLESTGFSRTRKMLLLK